MRAWSFLFASAAPSLAWAHLRRCPHEDLGRLWAEEVKLRLGTSRLWRQSRYGTGARERLIPWSDKDFPGGAVSQKRLGTGREAVGAGQEHRDQIADFRPWQHDVIAEPVER